MPGQTIYGKGGKPNRDILPNAHKKGYKYDEKMGVWYIPLAKNKNKSKLKIA